MQVNPSSSQSAGIQKPAAGLKGAAAAAGSAAAEQMQEFKSRQNKAEEIEHQVSDQSAVQAMKTSIKTPGLIELLDKGGPNATIDDTLHTALYAKMPFAREYAMQGLLKETKGMTPGELDDLKDAIVKRMSSPDSSQRERDVLKNMYDLVDAVAENRPVPMHLVAVPNKGPLDQTFPEEIIKPTFPVGKPGHPGKPLPNIMDLHHDDSVFMKKLSD